MLQAKHLQLTSGLQLSAYWFANLTADLLISVLFVISCFILFAIFQQFVPAYSGLALLAVFFLLLLFCWSSTPMVYLISLAFDNIYTAYTVIFITFFMSTLICLALLVIIDIIANLNTEADIFYYLFIFHPGFGFASGLSDLYVSYVYRDTCTRSDFSRQICDQNQVDYTASPFQITRPGIGGIMLVQALEGVIFFCLTILVDHWGQIRQVIQRRRLGAYQHRVRMENPSPLELETQTTSFEGRIPRSVSALSRSFLETIHDEKSEVLEVLLEEAMDPRYTVVVYRMEKDYHADRWCTSIRKPSDKGPAVKELIFKVEEGECFGLLGVNGAGKTTTFKILTGDITMTGGTAVIAGYDIRTQLRQVQQRIGYCPQFDALIERLTGRELLTMFARLRGIRESHIRTEVNDKIERLQLGPHADKQCWKYRQAILLVTM